MNKIIAIVGPTGSGKTSLAIYLALKLNGEIINADSIQIYKKIDVASAKPSIEDRNMVIHHLLDFKEIDDDYTVYNYQKEARKTINDILKRGKVPILVGGTGLYIKAALYDYNFKKEKKVFDYGNVSNEELYKELLKIDSNTVIHPNNRRRIERYLTYYKNNHKPYQKEDPKLLYDTVIIGLTRDRNKLYDSLDKRIDIMLSNGLIDEVKYMYNNYKDSKAVLNAIGYKELFLYFDGNMTLEESISKMKQRTRNYAKRQYTFFNNQMKVDWFNIDNKSFADILEFVNKKIN